MLTVSFMWGLLLACRQLRFSLLPAMTRALAVVGGLYYPYHWLCGISYALCLLPSPLQCSLVSSVGVAQLIPRYSANVSQLVQGFRPLSPFYLGCFALYLGIACLGYVHHGIACLASQASDWASTLWDSLSGLQLATLC